MISCLSIFYLEHNLPLSRLGLRASYHGDVNHLHNTENSGLKPEVPWRGPNPAVLYRPANTDDRLVEMCVVNRLIMCIMS